MSSHRNVILVAGQYGGFTIELAEHGNVHTTVMDGPSSGFLYYSGRISDACVEGSEEEMLAIADAIERRDAVHFKRCAVDAREVLEDDVLFWSPRNSRMRGAVDLDSALALAAQIRHELPRAAESESNDREKT